MVVRFGLLLFVMATAVDAATNFRVVHYPYMSRSAASNSCRAMVSLPLSRLSCGYG